MVEAANPEIKDKVLDYLHKVPKAKSRDIAATLDIKKALVDAAIKELANEDLVEYLYIGTTYVTLKGSGEGLPKI